MSTRSSLIAGAALTCLLSMMGCGSESDPATVPGQDGNDGSQDGNVGDGDGDGITDDGSDGNEDGTPGDGDGDATPGDGDGDATPGDGDGDGDGTPGACEANTNYVGQCFENPEKPNQGGMETDEPYAADYDSGIAALLAAGVTPMGMTVSLPLTDATVTATSFVTANANRAQSQFWLQDGKAAIQVFLPEGVAPVPGTVKVGSKISATVTKLTEYGGRLQIADATGWSFTAVDQPVFIDDRTGIDIVAADAAKLIRVTGTLAGEPTACGGSSKCWSFEYGGTAPVLFRSASTFIATGDCITFVGPVAAFDGNAQLDTVNFDWVWNNK